MPLGSWLYELNSTTGGGSGGGYVPPDAPPVQDLACKVEEIYGGQFEVTISYNRSPLATADNYRGAAVYLEDPDISNAPPVTMEGGTALDGSSEISGFWNPQKVSESFESPLVLRVDGSDVARKIRVYLQAFNRVVNATLIRANDPVRTPTPNVVCDIPAKKVGDVGSGQDFAELITNPSVTIRPDFENPAGPKYILEFNYTPPNPRDRAPGLEAFAGVRIDYKYANGSEELGPFLDVQKAEPWESPLRDISQTITFLCYFRSRNVSGRVNPIKIGVTPVVQVTVQYPPLGELIAPPVTGFTIEPLPHEWQPDGSYWAQAIFRWNPPASYRFAGVRFYRTSPKPVKLVSEAGNVAKDVRVSVTDWPTTATDWTIHAIPLAAFTPAVEADNPEAPSGLTPSAVWHIGPPGAGEGRPPLVDANSATLTTEQELNSDGVVMMRHKIAGWVNSTDNSFGGISIARVLKDSTSDPVWWDVPKGATSIVTPWEPAPTDRWYDFYFISRDQQGKRNPIQPGISPMIRHHFIPMEGDILASRLPKDWFNEAEFDWPEGEAGLFTVERIVSPKIYVGSILRVGGGTAGNAANFGGFQNGQIAVYNAANDLRAWVGQQDGKATPDNPTPHSIYGGWFKELYVGGNNPTDAPLWADKDGIVVVGGFDVGANRYPRISIRNASGVEVGRMGAKVGDGITTAGTPEAGISGAWFKEIGIGGLNLTDWRILAYKDATLGDLVKFRQINKFTIDYKENVPHPTNLFNSPMHFEVGLDAFVGDTTNSAYYKFPGIVMERYDSAATPAPTGHKASLLNRGLILDAPGPVNTAATLPPQRRASFVTYNGNQYGQDAAIQWWTELWMHSYISQSKPTVTISSGSTSSNGHPSLVMFDASGSLQRFKLDGVTGDLEMGGQLRANGGINISTGVNTGDIRTQGNISGAAYYVNFGSRLIISQTGALNCWDSLAYENSTIITRHTNGTIMLYGGYILASSQFYAQGYGGSTDSFKDQLGRTVTVKGGIIVSIA